MKLTLSTAELAVAAKSLLEMNIDSCIPEEDSWIITVEKVFKYWYCECGWHSVDQLPSHNTPCPICSKLSSTFSRVNPKPE